MQIRYDYVGLNFCIVAAAATAKLRPVPVTTPRRILIVEQEATIADDLRHGLQSLAYDVTGTVSTAAEALRLTGSARPDVVLVDISRRRGDQGVQAAREIAENCPVPVVLLAADSTPSTSAGTAGAPAHGFLVKPFTVDALRTTIDTAFYRHGMSDQLRRLEERRTLETKLHETQKLESLGLLAGGIAHDFNNLLTAILGNTEVAETELPAGSPVLEHLDAVKRAARRATELCRQMLAYAGQGAYFPACLNVTDLIRATMPVLENAVGRSAQLRCKLTEELPRVNVDRAQLQQVLLYLVTNAAESFDYGVGVVNVSTGVVSRAPGMFRCAVVVPPETAAEFVVIEVQDNGPGIEPDTLKRIWDPFFSTKFAGRGLGLPAVHGIVRTAGGGIMVDSRRGIGSTFRIFLPTVAKETAVEPAGVRDATPPAPGAGMRGWVLIVDDEESIRKLLERTMPLFGLSGVAVATAEAAVAALQVKPRAERVLLDATMPGIDTAALARTMQSTHPTLPIVLMSGYIEAHTSGRFKDIAFAGFLQKPFTREEVGRAMKAAPPRAK